MKDDRYETTATGKWAQAGVPHRGWQCTDIEGLEEQNHLCEMCEARHVRFVHVMEHPTYPEILRVGCVCPGNMEGNPVGARKRENGFKSERSRRVRWTSRQWRVSAAGNEFLNTNDGFNVVVFPKGGIWGARVEHRASSYQRTSKRPYNTSDEAKLAAFDAMIGMKHSEPWKK